MKRKDLKGTWQEAVERFENCWAPDILGWWYSRHCLGEKLDMDALLAEFRNWCVMLRKYVYRPEYWQPEQKEECMDETGH